MIQLRLSYCALAVVLLVTACGGGGKQNTSKSATSPGVSPAASPAASSASGGGYLSATTAPIPASLHCGATKPVWVNTRSKAYHLASDPYYGRTKHGEYMCPSQAAQEGYHQAGAGSMRPHHRRGGNTMQAQPSPSPGSY
jgi:hypothetical protein